MLLCSECLCSPEILILNQPSVANVMGWGGALWKMARQEGSTLLVGIGVLRKGMNGLAHLPIPL